LIQLSVAPWILCVSVLSDTPEYSTNETLRTHCVAESRQCRSTHAV